MFNIMHSGREKTPLHLMTAHHVYDKCKSKELLTTLNRVEVSVSYNEVQQARRSLAKCTVWESEGGNVPLPSQFISDQFTLAAFNSFDHCDCSSLSGKRSSHDTVMTVFQVQPVSTLSKLSISSTGINISNKNIPNKLPYQHLMEYTRRKKDLTIPDTFIVEKSMLSNSRDVPSKADIEFLICYMRSCLTSTENFDIPTWAGCHSLLEDSKISIMQVGFLPYVPHPVTEHTTVYTALHNFLSVLSQLEQTYMPVACDEGVIRIVADIVLKFSHKFDSLVPMLAGLHMAKAALHCVGKYLKKSGTEDVLLETGILV